MELVIKIPDDEYKQMKDYPSVWNSHFERIIANGTPLPKGHGRLIDADKLDSRERGNNSQRTMWWQIDCIVKHAPTIIEADKESEAENETDN